MSHAHRLTDVATLRRQARKHLEAGAVTAGYRAAHVQAVYAFSPFDEDARSHRWNPLTAVRTSPLHRVGDLLGIGQVFYPNDGSGTSSEAFFNDPAGTDMGKLFATRMEVTC